MSGAEHDHLRPVERRVLRWAETGLDDAEIARRFGRSERWVAQVRMLAGVDRSAPRTNPTHRAGRTDRAGPTDPSTGCGLSNAGCSGGGEQGPGTRSSAAGSAAAPSSSRVEDYANYKLAMA